MPRKPPHKPPSKPRIKIPPKPGIPAPGSEELSPGCREFVQKVLKEDASTPVFFDPIDEFMFELELREKDPKLLAKVADILNKRRRASAEGEEEESDSGQEQTPEEEPIMRVVKRDGDYLYWESLDGTIKYTELEETDDDYYGPDEDAEDEEFDLDDEEGVDDTDYEDDEDDSL